MARKKKETDIMKQGMDLPRDLTFAVDGANTKSVYIIQELLTWPKINLAEPKEVEARIDKYFRFMAQMDSKPLVTGLAHALGVNRNKLREIAMDIPNTARTSTTLETREMIARAYEALETAWEFNFANGKINPVTGIFLGRNHFGYQDRSEVIVIPKNPLGEEIDKERLEERLLASIVDE